MANDGSSAKFVVLGSPRSGTTMLLSYLNSHPNVKAKGELFRFLRGRSSEGLWADAFMTKKVGVHAVGFKLLRSHPEDSIDKSVWSRIKGDEKLKILHLRRKNLVRWYVSRLVALQTSCWNTYSRKKVLPLSERKIHVNVAEALASFESELRYHEQIERYYSKSQLLKVVYEDLVRSGDQEFSRIFKFLSIPDCRVRSSTVKINFEPLHDLITNYKEVESRLKNTPYSCFLE